MQYAMSYKRVEMYSFKKPDDTAIMKSYISIIHNIFLMQIKYIFSFII